MDGPADPSFLFPLYFRAQLSPQHFFPPYGHLSRRRFRICGPRIYADRVGTNFSP